MKLFGKNLNKEILYIAEIGVNHEGSMKRCFKLIKEAKKAGADVVKFQCFTPEKYISTEEPKYKIIKKFYFNKKEFKKIIDYCKKLKIYYLFTPVSHDWIGFIKKYSKTIKVASGDLNFNFLIKSIVKSKFNIILSTGISELNEIKKTINIIKSKYKNNIKSKLVLMHCVSNYPVHDSQANLRSINFLKDKFKLTTGYSNHVIGINACLASICLGARVLEFHFTDNKNRKFRDHQLSLDRSDVSKLIKMSNNFNILIGKYEKTLDSHLIKNKPIFSKGIIANKDLKKNHRLSIKDLSYARPAKYYFANDIKKVINKTIKRNISFGSLIKKANLK
jgi:N,N'-diacetyllegionaminate synthase